MKLITAILASVFVLICMVSCKNRMDHPKEKGSKKSAVTESDNDFVGLTEQAGVALAGKRTLRFRIVSVDGQMRPATRDFRPDRINAELEKGIIVKVTRG